MTTASDEGKVKKKRLRHPDRPMLTPEAQRRVDRWAEQLAPRLSGRLLPRGELITWLIIRHSDELAEAELVALHGAYYDPVRALKWAVRVAEEAKSRGETVNVQEIIGGPNFRRSPHAARPSGRQRASTAAGGEPDGDAAKPSANQPEETEES